MSFETATSAPATRKNPLLFEIVLRGVVATKEMSVWNQIDYNDPSTYPDENRPCIIAWENHHEHPDRHAMHVFNMDCTPSGYRPHDRGVQGVTSCYLIRAVAVSSLTPTATPAT